MLTLRRCGVVNSLAVSSIKESEVTEISLSTETKTMPINSALSPLNHVSCKGEGLIQLAESSQIVTAKQETGGIGGDSPQSQMVVSTSGQYLLSPSNPLQKNSSVDTDVSSMHVILGVLIFVFRSSQV